VQSTARHAFGPPPLLPLPFRHPSDGGGEAFGLDEVLEPSAHRPLDRVEYSAPHRLARRH
jgi:hypothetical protein